ncbi:MAG: prepilin-type N-terminal cleavage/methylation domain-containing protein [Thermomonas sp.]|uniref:prepilin-type N-terminal cleavage/methylation domain-containing protein n=1 Tax=Thermomonas sp. TaxID=1971895 RepID=UPI001D86BA28|nr:prepilin-type N-terminal cleavage/methylation domain-containing protein [Thermomonas sp.]MBZ0087811.1 prepilin-type N-terminal cleavage/methylation domain-containing protein [Thermomonas sp.]
MNRPARASGNAIRLGHTPSRRSAAAGFTLLEVMLAVALLAAALALAFGILRAAGATVERGETIAARNERIRAVSGFLRARIAGSEGMVFGLDPGSGRSLRFEGEENSLRFVADLPDYLGRGGPYLHEFKLGQDAGKRALLVDFRMIQGDEILPSARPPEPLARDVATVEFAYRAVDVTGNLGPWLPRWTAVDALPQQVRVRIRDGNGAWPELVVAMKLSTPVPDAGQGGGP